MSVVPVPWWKAEPARLARDQHEVSEVFPSLTFRKDGQAGWSGRLPVWPFARPAPPRLDELVPDGVEIVLAYGAAYPIVSPWLFPRDPEPLPLELTQTRWHVLGNGALCLFQTQADWDPASSVVDLLRKAAGWRVEYALLKAGVREDMSLSGIVNDDSLDHLVPTAAKLLATPAGREPSAGQAGGL